MSSTHVREREMKEIIHHGMSGFKKTVSEKIPSFLP